MLQGPAQLGTGIAFTLQAVEYSERTTRFAGKPGIDQQKMAVARRLGHRRFDGLEVDPALTLETDGEFLEFLVRGKQVSLGALGQELGAAVELGLPLPILLWDNGKLKEIEDSMVRSQIAPNSVIAHNPDFCALARAYGANAAHPKTLSELTEATLSAAVRSSVRNV